MAKEHSLSFQSAAKTLYAAMQILKENGDGMKAGDLMEAVGKKVELSDWEKETTSKGGIRWQNIYHFTSVDYVKAGFIIKKSGSWYLTPDGEFALKKNQEDILEIAMNVYRNWRKEVVKSAENIDNAEDEPDNVVPIVKQADDIASLTTAPQPSPNVLVKIKIFEKSISFSLFSRFTAPVKLIYLSNPESAAAFLHLSSNSP